MKFTTLLRPEEFRGQRGRALQWPYVEGLRMDEAMHPLAILAVGVYGKTLLNQQGPPLRLVVPWKYGFKSIKSIVKIEFVEDQPRNSWNVAIPSEYGFYFECESGGQPSSVDPGDRAQDRLFLPDPDTDVQRLRRPGREPLRRDGPRAELLISRFRLRGRREPGGPDGPCCRAAGARIPGGDSWKYGGAPI